MGSIPAWAGEPGPTFHYDRRAWVYPRVGGGAPLGIDIGFGCQGLSPRGRGSLGSINGPEDIPGSIPAWAGEPMPSVMTIGAQRVYPRVGGGARPGRGILRLFGGSIPAWAGEPLCRIPLLIYNVKELRLQGNQFTHA